MRMVKLVAMAFLASIFLSESYAADKMWSILICTLQERQQSFTRLFNKLKSQISSVGLDGEIEIIYFLDNREKNVGFKRNCLLQASQAKYTCFVDDDDDIHDNYIKMIYEKLLQNPDCVSLLGVIKVNGKDPRTFIHSLKYDHYFTQDGVYYRPPNHLNPIRRSIAIQFKFPEKNFGEDTDWAMLVARSGLLKSEAEITDPYYFYDYIPNKPTAKAFAS